MVATWFIGDLHFGHAKVAEIRGYDSTEQHDAHLTRVWNETVRTGDLVWVLGDLSGGSSASEARALSMLRELPGRKRLICGNHDSIAGIHRRPSPNTALFREVFEQISDYGRVRVDREQVYLSHYPYESQGDGPGRGEARYVQYRMADRGAKLMHAHTHHVDPFDGSATGREMCVSWDAWKRMVGLGDVSAWLGASLVTHAKENA